MFENHMVHKNLRRHVHYLSSVIGERHMWNNKSLDRAAEYIDSEFRKKNFEVNHQTYSCYGKNVSNVIVKKKGRVNDAIVIGAHYDTVPGSPGADDNASSVAVMLETAKLSRAIHNENTLVFVAFANEESPCYGTENMGSMVYADSLRNSGVSVRVMICLESIGYFSEDEYQQYPIPGMRLLYPKMADFLVVVGNFKSRRYVSYLRRAIRKNTRIHVRSLIAPEYVAGINRSDQFAFWHYGFNAVMITDTAFYRNKNYHRETDTIDTLNFDFMTQIVKGLYGALEKF